MERGGVVDVVEHIGGGLVDRGRARAGHRVGSRTGMDRAGLEPICDVMRGCRALLAASGDWRLRRAVADDAAVDPAPRQLAAEPAELDLRTAVHDDLDPGLFGRR